MDIEEQKRIEAVNRYLKGDKPANTYRKMNRSETWLFKWVNRLKRGDEEWYIVIPKSLCNNCMEAHIQFWMSSWRYRIHNFK
ncbi:MAG: helix-turn-helix domain-containing protein [Methanophagales archaeon]|nr:helix-turn-helix domain-containing protein [Methanophagales archaeon]